MLNKCLEFSGLFEIIRKMFECFRLKVGFLVVIALKKQKQIDDESAAREDPSSTFCSYVVKFHPFVITYASNAKFITIHILFRMSWNPLVKVPWPFF